MSNKELIYHVTLLLTFVETGDAISYHLYEELCS